MPAERTAVEPKLAKAYRVLVVFSLATSIIIFFEWNLFGPYFSEETSNLLAWSGYSPLVEIPMSIWWLWTLLFVAIRIGLLNFSVAARTAFAIFSISSCLTFLLTGIQVWTPFSSAIGSLAGLADGAILALAYCSELKRNFR